ncbi:MAG: hypothetical protein JSV73_04805 [Flavobacteriaceae bacterium]|nr:MAG: hypothetical protein JSV73_04805 [Flavobacteriaceae bacterium]
MNFEQLWFDFSLQELLQGKKRLVENLMITAYNPMLNETPFYENLLIRDSTPPVNQLTMALQFHTFFGRRPEQIAS